MANGIHQLTEEQRMQRSSISPPAGIPEDLCVDRQFALLREEEGRGLGG